MAALFLVRVRCRVKIMGLKALGEVPLEVKSLLVMNDHFKHKETKLLQGEK